MPPTHSQVALDKANEARQWLQELLDIAKRTGAAAAIKAAQARRDAALAKQHEAQGWDEAARLAGHHNPKQKIHYVLNLRKENRALKLVPNCDCCS